MHTRFAAILSFATTAREAEGLLLRMLLKLLLLKLLLLTRRCVTMYKGQMIVRIGVMVKLMVVYYVDVG